jgi:hypothetical protein
VAVVLGVDGVFGVVVTLGVDVEGMGVTAFVTVEEVVVLEVLVVEVVVVAAGVVEVLNVGRLTVGKLRLLNNAPLILLISLFMLWMAVLFELSLLYLFA